MECNPEGLSVLGYPILSDYNYEQERGQGAGGGELATAGPSSGGQGGSERGPVLQFGSRCPGTFPTR